MKVSGSHRLDVSRQALWDALQDPSVLARTLPGCQTLEVTAPDSYAATVTAGVASVKGTYRGKVTLADKQAPESYRLTAQGAGGPGTIQADALVRLVEDDGGGTVVHYDADAVVGGMIGGVGQRMLQGVAKKTAGEFFDAVERDLLYGPTVPAGVPTGAPAGAPAGAPGPAPAVGEVYRREPTPAAVTARRPSELVGALVLGAAIALVGVLVGRRLGRDDGGRP